MQEIINRLTDQYDREVADLSLEDAIEVAEGLAAFVESALAGLRDDLDQE